MKFLNHFPNLVAPRDYCGFLFALFAFLWIGLNLRAPITSVAPIVHQIRTDLGLSASTVALLTSIPILCFGVMTPFASLLIRRLSIDKAVFVALLGIASGTVLRACGETQLMLGGTFVIGTALTIGNIVCLIIIARDFCKHMHLVTGLYVVAMSIGSMSTSALTAPLSLVTGWRFSIGVWAILPLLALALWAVVVARRHGDDSEQFGVKAENLLQEAPSATYSVIKNPLVLLLTMAFVAHLVLFYSLTAWLPTYYMQTQGMSETRAGIVESVFQSAAFIGALGVPILASLRWISNSMIMITVSVVWCVTPLSFLYYPDWWLVTDLVSGFAQGGGFAIIFSVLMTTARDLDENRRMSSFVQGVGYAVSSVGPLLIGSVHEITGSWRSPMLLLAGISFLFLFAAFGIMIDKRKRE